MGSRRHWLRLGRPHFLIGGIAFVLLGALLARQAGHTLSLLEYVLVQAFVTATQLGVHYGNEWHDLPADRANAVRTRFAGGSRVLVEGLLPPASARSASWAFFSLALVVGIALGARHGAPVVAVAGAILVLSWGYSAPPLRLHSRGIGGLSAGLIVAGLVPALALVTGGATIGRDATVALVPLVLQVAALVGVLSLPDAAGDAVAGKRTLVVRLGTKRAGRVMQAAWVVAGLWTLAAIVLGRPPVVALAAGSGLALTVAFPVLAGTRRWDLLALCAGGLVALQWLVTTVPLW